MIPVKVLIVEDSPIALEILQRILSSSTDIEIAGTARNGKQALELIPSAKPDVICVDYYMERMDGLELTRQVMAKYPRPHFRLKFCTRQYLFQFMQNRL
jgi:two-component system, chemotaxis family, protein-glutamate methylesterase/glutaminase